jgi:hypothetical protein
MRRAHKSGGRSGQAAVEFVVLYGGVILPLSFMLIFVAEMFWVWHSVTDFTRDGARYAATHCWYAGGTNVLTYMQTHVPRMIDMDQFMSNAAEITVTYYSKDATTGTLSEYACANSECSVDCIPDAVSVSILNYQFARFSSFMKLAAVTMPDFRTSMAMESGGCDETGSCLP